MTTDSNIIQFPKSHSHTINIEKVLENVGDSKVNLVTAQTDWILEKVFMIIAQMGLIQQDKLAECDMMLVYESINGMLPRYYSMEHPLHETARELFDEQETMETLLNDTD